MKEYETNEIEKAYRAGFEAGFGEAQSSPGVGEEEIVAAFKDYVSENKLQSAQGVDWRLVLQKVMWCFIQEEGTLYSHHWHEYGLTEPEIGAADTAFDEYQTLQSGR